MGRRWDGPSGQLRSPWQAPTCPGGAESVPLQFPGHVELSAPWRASVPAGGCPWPWQEFWPQPPAEPLALALSPAASRDELCRCSCPATSATHRASSSSFLVTFHTCRALPLAPGPAAIGPWCLSSSAGLSHRSCCSCRLEKSSQVRTVSSSNLFFKGSRFRYR